MQANRWIVCGAIVGAVGVSLGAFGAHGVPGFLKGQGHSPEDIATWMENYETAVRYHMYHAPMIILLGVLLSRGGRCCSFQAAGWLFLAGIALFSGSLYVWVLTADKFHGLVHIVPVGGTLLIAAWIAVAIGGARASRHET